MTNGIALTPTQQRLFDKLSDGEPHTFDELFPLLDGCEDGVIDRATARGALHIHIHRLRNKMAEFQDNDRVIVCEFFSRRSHYRIMRRLHPQSSPRKT